MYLLKQSIQAEKVLEARRYNLLYRIYLFVTARPAELCTEELRASSPLETLIAVTPERAGASCWEKANASRYGVLSLVLKGTIPSSLHWPILHGLWGGSVWPVELIFINV